jgi:CubicO group peptidase (beta-lactamase class C family)
VFQYNNLMYMAAGHVIAYVSGQSWEAFTRAQILEPLGMVNTLFSVVEAQQTADFARPHMEEKDDQIKEISSLLKNLVGRVGAEIVATSGGGSGYSTGCHDHGGPPRSDRRG